MPRETTISTHGSSHRKGTRGNQDHNNREPGITDHEDHIQPGGHWEAWIHEDVGAAYDRIFGEALAEYNARQRPARQIPDYLAHLQEKVRQYDARVTQLKEHPEQSMGRDRKPKFDKDGNPVMKQAKPPVQPYRELIVGVYRDVDQEDAKAILKDYLAGFKDRNPNMEVIGAYYHADEEGQPGLHIDYIPVSRKSGKKRGLSVQNNMEEALKEQGIMPTGKQTQTPLQQWTARENAYLESLVLQRGKEQGKDYAVIHPEAGKHSRHKQTWLYKLEQEAKKQQATQEAQDAKEKEQEATQKAQDAKEKEQAAKDTEQATTAQKQAQKAQEQAQTQASLQKWAGDLSEWSAVEQRRLDGFAAQIAASAPTSDAAILAELNNRRGPDGRTLREVLEADLTARAERQKQQGITVTIKQQPPQPDSIAAALLLAQQQREREQARKQTQQGQEQEL